MLRTKIFFHYSRYASVLCQSECACLHKTVNMVVFFVKSNENGRALMPMYRVVPITKREYQMVFVHRMEYTTNFIIKLIYFFFAWFIDMWENVRIVYSSPSSSSSSSLLIWKYRSSYVSLAEATTRSQSRRLFFFKYFFVKYFKYLKRKQHHLLTKLTQAIF